MAITWALAAEAGMFVLEHWSEITAIAKDVSDAAGDGGAEYVATERCGGVGPDGLPLQDGQSCDETLAEYLERLAGESGATGTEYDVGAVLAARVGASGLTPDQAVAAEQAAPGVSAGALLAGLGAAALVATKVVMR